MSSLQSSRPNLLLTSLAGRHGALRTMRGQGGAATTEIHKKLLLNLLSYRLQYLHLLLRLLLCQMQLCGKYWDLQILDLILALMSAWGHLWAALRPTGPAGPTGPTGPAAMNYSVHNCAAVHNCASTLLTIPLTIPATPLLRP